MNKWVPHIIRKADNTIERYKARLVANEETFSLEVKFSSICLILALVAHINLKLHQMDVMIVFLNGEQEGEIYMEQPVNFCFNKPEAHKYACLNS